MATTSTRESRRRKILERGSDRLAFVTGKLQSLPPHSPDQTDCKPPPPSLSHHPVQDLPTNFSTQAADTPVYPDAHDEVSSPVLLKHDPCSDADQSHTISCNGEIGEESISHRGETSIEPPKDPDLSASCGANSLPVSFSDQTSFISNSGAVQHPETRTQQHNLFNPKQISFAIDASEKTRLLCSVIVAIIVVLSHLGIPILGNKFLGSIISFRPLYFILLTNITVVIMPLLFHDHGGSQRDVREENKNALADENNWAEQLSKTLEVGLLAQKVINAVFMDCSVYAIIVICGLSFI